MRCSNHVGRLAGAFYVLMSLSLPSMAQLDGGKTEDIIYGCNQFIKFARKGSLRQDADTSQRLGECLGAVRTMLATEVANDFICPSNEVKLVDAVTAFSLYIIRHPSEMKSLYVAPMRQAFRDAYPCS